MLGRPSYICLKFHFKPRSCKPIGWNIVAFIFQSQNTISGIRYQFVHHLFFTPSPFYFLWSLEPFLPHHEKKEKRTPGARELISMLLNHTYKLHITYTTKLYICILHIYPTLEKDRDPGFRTK